MAVSNKDLALAIIGFLEASVANKTVSEEFTESIDVAIDCIADAFEVDKANSKTISSKFGGKDLLAAVNASGVGASGTASGAEKPAEADPETRAKADALKAEGNKAMAAKDFATAISKYSEAIALDAANVVYLSNRAAAHSSALQHDKAVEDAEKAIQLDPSFSKAYSRLGLAQYALGNAKASMDAYKKGMEVEGTPSDAMKRGYETAKKRVETELENSISRSSPEASGSSSESGVSSGAGAGAGGLPDLASMFGGGGAGGMPNFAEMMNNPQVMQAAQNLMSNPGALQGLMNNPMLKSMMQNMGGDQGLEGLMNNPALQDMAKKFMGGSNGDSSNNGSGSGSGSGN